MRIGILGGTGWLGLALGQNLLRRGMVPADLAVANRRGPTADYDAWPGVRWAEGLDALSQGAGMIVLSVRPEDYAPGAPRAFGGVVLSFMAGIGLDRLRADWPHARIALAMPGGGATTGSAHVPWCGPDLPEAEAQAVTATLSAIGTVDRVADERALAVLAALSGSGSAYPALMAQAMFAHACAQGIPPDVAWRGVVSVICDATGPLRNGPEAAERLLATYHGYRGITDAGLNAAKAAGFTRALDDALTAATAKALKF